MDPIWEPTLGAVLTEDGQCRFRVWAPDAEAVALHLLTPQDRVLAMEPEREGYYTLALENVPAGSTYYFRLDGEDRPDPASRYQPEGPHGPSQVIERVFAWDDTGWHGIPLEAYIIYELHVGTFTPEGTFDAIIPHLYALKDLGVTVIELMPVAQFPGERNWGYDGVGLYATQNSYGGPDGLKRLVNACHQRGLAVVLDVVYNHLGAEGNYLHAYGPYFTDRYHTPWGAAVNLDGPHSDEVRHFFLENALMWITEFHIDGLRLDATHAYLDFSALPFLEELAQSVHAHANRLNRQVYLIAENDRSDDRLLRPPELGGYGLDAQWSDDLHHVLHTLFTGETYGYYQDFGQFAQAAKALRQGFVYAGEYSPFRQRRHGSFRPDLPARHFVVCTQNHDQVGNRMLGERLSQLVSFETLKLAAGVVLLSPYVPLLFMGEEYGEPAPFLYFTSHTDPDLAEAVRQGRRAEFADFQWQGEAPDPQDPDTFQRSKLDHGLRQQGHHARLLAFYTELIRLRRTHPALRQLSKEQLEVVGYDRQQVLYLHRWHGPDAVFAVFNFSEQPQTLAPPVPGVAWRKLLDSTDAPWSPDDQSPGGQAPDRIEEDSDSRLQLAPRSLVVYTRNHLP